MLNSIKSEWSSFIWLNLAYIAVYSMTIGLILPLQSRFAPITTGYIGFAFLPHGVRILAFYLYGLRGAIYLLPASYLMLFVLAQKGIYFNVTLPLASTFACYFGYWAVRALVFDGKCPSIASGWTFFSATGLCAAVFNAIAMSYVQTGTVSISDLVAIIAGDMTGMFIFLIAAIYFFRLARLVGNAVKK